MKFLRLRNNEIETAYMPDKFNAIEKGHALFVLGGAVILARHPYDRSPQSGSGNCWCGRHQSHIIHTIVIDPPNYI